MACSPLDAFHVHVHATENHSVDNEDTNLEIDYNRPPYKVDGNGDPVYDENGNLIYLTPLQALSEAAEEGREIDYTYNGKDLTYEDFYSDDYSEPQWRQVFKGDFDKLREWLESDDPDDRYIVLMEDIKKTIGGSSDWEAIEVKSQADLVTTVSPGKVRKLKGHAPGAEICFVPNGLDERFLDNEFHPETVEKYGLDAGFNCVYIGSFGRAQGLMQLMHLAERAKEKNLDARFVLFGNGVEEESLRRYAEDHQLDNVVFEHMIPNGELLTLLKAAQLSFVSLINEKLRDSVPTKMFEALGVGCPVLLAAAGDAADLLNECGLGIAVQPNHDDDLWNAFMELYSNRDQYLQHCENARNVILNRYSRQQAAVVLENHLERIIANGTRNTVG